VLRALALFGAIAYGAEVLPVVPLQWTPQQIFNGLRTTKPPMPAADCKALKIFACQLSYPTRVEDISLRWVQLDDDPEREAIIVARAEREWDYIALVFDWRKTWNLVGAVWCARHCIGGDPSFVRVQNLSEFTPAFVIFRRDLGGSGHSLDTRTFYHLRNGQLHQVFELTDATMYMSVPDTSVETVRLHQSDRWIIHHTVHESPPGKNRKDTCKVLTWSASQFRFIDAPSQNANFCDPTTNRPIFGKTFSTRLH